VRAIIGPADDGRGRAEKKVVQPAAFAPALNRLPGDRRFVAPLERVSRTTGDLSCHPDVFRTALSFFAPLQLAPAATSRCRR
jgi:hypothetical protein